MPSSPRTPTYRALLAASVAAVPPVVLLAITHLTVILTRPAGTDTEPRAGASLSTVTADALPELPTAGPQQPARGTTATVVDRRALGWELREAGWSNKRIARELGVGRSTLYRALQRVQAGSADVAH